MDGRGGTAAAAGELEAVERLILQWDSAVAGEERMLFDGGDSSEAQRYLRAVNKICQSIKEQSITATGSPRRLLSTSSSSLANAVQIAMARLEDEFRNILISQASEIDVESLTNLSSFSMSSSLDAKHSGVLSDRDSSSGDGAVLSESVELSESILESEGSCRGTQRSRCCTTRSISKIDLMPSDAIPDLWSIAEGMILAGYGRECIQSLQLHSEVSIGPPPPPTRCREAQHRRRAAPRVGCPRVQDPALDPCRTCVAIRIVFASERHLSDRVFNALLPSDVDTPFTETIKGPTLQLFSFVEAISIGHRSPKKLFKILHLHDALSNLLPDIAAIFCSKSSNSVYIQASEILSRLAEAVRSILSKFESTVVHDHSTTAVPGGTIHPLTHYVMNYISLIPGYKPTLTNLILSCPRFFSVDDPIITPLELDIREDSNDQSPLASHLTWIIAILVQNLENKANLYKDAALSHLFMMNNVHYIVHKVKEESPDLREMIGDSYLRELTRTNQHEPMIYQHVTWMKILQCLRDKGLHMSGGSRGFSSGVSKLVLRERFRGFNDAFDEAHRIQSMWIVPDEQLREELRISILEKMLPAYRSFLGRFRQHIENGKHPKMYIKYTVEKLEPAISDFFEGHPPSLLNRRKSH